MAANQQLTRLIALVGGLTALNGLATGYTLYNSNSLLERNYEDAEARMDELEGTLRGHIGLIEESLERIENRQMGKPVKGGWGQGMGERAQAVSFHSHVASGVDCESFYNCDLKPTVASVSTTRRHS